MDANGAPFLIHGDSPWSVEVQLTRAQITTYLNDRQAKGFNTLMFQAAEHYFSSQTPPWKNAEGNVPFSPDGNFGTRIEAYWQLIDYLVTEANRRGIVCIFHPAYLGFGGGEQGWTSEILAESASDLQSYGSFLANRYRGTGIIWCMGGDYTGTNHAGLLTKQWNIATGIRAVDGAAVITAHGSRTLSAYSAWGSGFAGFNLNNIYTDGTEYGYAATEYARPGPMPFFLIEGFYDGESATAADCRRQAYAAVLSGGCGHLFGNKPIWGFGEPNANGGGGAAASLNALTTTATAQMPYVKQLFSAYAWWKLEPQTGTRLVTTSLGSGKSRVCPALASDGSFAMIWTTGSGFSVDMSALSSGSVRARWYDTTSGSYASVSGSPFANTGTRGFTPAGERVLVLDAA